MSWLFSRGWWRITCKPARSVGEQFAQLSTNSTPLAYLCNDKTMGSFRHSRYGITFAHLTEDIGEELLTWFREVSCQDISPARTNGGNKGKGLDGSKSGLWSEFARIIGEVEPKWVLVENSHHLRTKGLGRVLKDLACLRYDAAWGVLSAKDCGANHERKRMWIVAHANDNGNHPVKHANAETFRTGNNPNTNCPAKEGVSGRDTPTQGWKLRKDTSHS